MNISTITPGLIGNSHHRGWSRQQILTLALRVCGRCLGEDTWAARVHGRALAIGWPYGEVVVVKLAEPRCLGQGQVWHGVMQKELRLFGVAHAKGDIYLRGNLLIPKDPTERQLLLAALRTPAEAGVLADWFEDHDRHQLAEDIRQAVAHGATTTFAAGAILYHLLKAASPPGG